MLRSMRHLFPAARIILGESFLSNGFSAGFAGKQRKYSCMYTVTDRSKETLENAIRASVTPGFIKISDMWSLYIGIEELLGMNYTHQTVNHSQNFVNPATGEHTQTIESLWHTFKMRNKRECGTYRAMVDSYLCQCM